MLFSKISCRFGSSFTTKIFFSSHSPTSPIFFWSEEVLKRSLWMRCVRCSKVCMWNAEECSNTKVDSNIIDSCLENCFVIFITDVARNMFRNASTRKCVGYGGCRISVHSEKVVNISIYSHVIMFIQRESSMRIKGFRRKLSFMNFYGYWLNTLWVFDSN